LAVNVSELLDSYLNPGFRYVFAQGPDRVRTRADALANGLNCVALAHLALRDLFGVTLPARLRSVELSSDLRYFHYVPLGNPLELGDLVWFGPAAAPMSLADFIARYDSGGELLNFSEFPINHVAVYLDYENGHRRVLHASPADGTNAIWPLRRFGDYDRYNAIKAVQRLRTPLSTLPGESPLWEETNGRMTR
jgi:hypothetical protein